MSLRSPRALLLLDRKLASFLRPQLSKAELQGNVVLELDYRRLHSQIDVIRKALQEHNLDFVLFSRNDQILARYAIGEVIRELRVGYSTFSAIDENDVWQQTEQCLNDYLERPRSLSFPDRKSGKPDDLRPRGSFSLIFDVEQLAGTRFGLPRILELLEEFNARATFFVTNLVEEVYPNTIEQIVSGGHEVGLHGQYHEYLSGLPLEEQIDKIAQMRSDFRDAEPIRGVNFIYRMDKNTVDASIQNGIAYFVDLMEHGYRPFRFSKPLMRPTMVCSTNGMVRLVPISVETYNRPWFAVKNMIRSAAKTARDTGWNHLNILCHPFRDGSLRHIADLRKLLLYMTLSLSYQAYRLQEKVSSGETYHPDCLVYYELDPNKRATLSRPSWNRWWKSRHLYELRIGNLVESLRIAGKRPALCLTPEKTNCLSVYPNIPTEDDSFTVELDPLGCQPGSRSLRESWDQFDLGKKGLAYLPSNRLQDVKKCLLTMFPRNGYDCTAILPEVALRIAYRLAPHRRLF